MEPHRHLPDDSLSLQRIVSWCIFGSYESGFLSGHDSLYHVRTLSSDFKTFSSHGGLKLSRCTTLLMVVGLTSPNGPTNKWPSSKLLWHSCRSFAAHHCVMAHWSYVAFFVPYTLQGKNTGNGQMVSFEKMLQMLQYLKRCKKEMLVCYYWPSHWRVLVGL